ncbi:MAG: SRPBCC family protein, partial [Sulfurifustaceae bacterium]
INVSARNGVVTLAGPILADEVPLVIDCALDVPGVRDVVNRLDVHRVPGNIPALQGGAAGRRSLRTAWRQTNWSPTARMAAGVAGAAAGVFGFAGRGIVRKAVGLAGVGVLARSAANLPVRALAGMGGRRGITVQKTIRMNAPIERVFEIWAQGESFPQFMTHVQEVQRLGDGRDARWHWKVRGTSGMEFEFDSRITAYEENRFIAWRTEPGAWVQHAGSVRFTPNSDGTTTAQVRMEYQPVAGAVGHVIAKLLGDDPKRQLDDDLMRMKAFVETGKAARDAAAPRPAL